jgi:hypothetical protein
MADGRRPMTMVLKNPINWAFFVGWSLTTPDVQSAQVFVKELIGNK